MSNSVPDDSYTLLISFFIKEAQIEPFQKAGRAIAEKVQQEKECISWAFSVSPLSTPPLRTSVYSLKIELTCLLFVYQVRVPTGRDGPDSILRHREVELLAGAFAGGPVEASLLRSL